MQFAPASSSQLSVIKVLGPDLAKDSGERLFVTYFLSSPEQYLTITPTHSAARCALLEASKSIEQAMEVGGWARLHGRE